MASVALELEKPKSDFDDLISRVNKIICRIQSFTPGEKRRVKSILLSDVATLTQDWLAAGRGPFRLTDELALPVARKIRTIAGSLRQYAVATGFSATVLGVTEIQLSD